MQINNRGWTSYRHDPLVEVGGSSDELILARETTGLRCPSKLQQIDRETSFLVDAGVGKGRNEIVLGSPPGQILTPSSPTYLYVANGCGQMHRWAGSAGSAPGGGVGVMAMIAGISAN